MNRISRRDLSKLVLAGTAGLALGKRTASGLVAGASASEVQGAAGAPATGPGKSADARNGKPAPRLEDGRPDWSDVLVVEQPEPIISYRTGWVVYEESLSKGQFVGRGWNGAGYVNFYDGRLDPSEYPEPEAFQLEIDGQLLATDWKWVGLEKTPSVDGKMQVTVTVEHGIRPVSVKVHTKLDGTPVLTRWLEVSNTGTKPAAVSVASPWSGVVRKTERWQSHLDHTNLPLYSIGYFERTKWGREGDFQWHDLPAAGYRISGKYRVDRYRQPMFLLRNNATGELFIGQLAWSGGYSFVFDLDPEAGETQDAAALSFNAGLDAPAPLRVIAPGETIATPEMHLGLVFGDLDTAVQAMHRHLRRSLFLPQARGHGAWVISGIGPEVEITPEQVDHAIDTAAEIGAEVFFIDASWYARPKSFWWNTVGDWDVNRQRFPQGLEPIRDRVHAKGMLWGLWMDAERIGVESQVVKDHPDWLAMNYDGQREMGGQLDLTNPQAAKWMEEQIARVIQENQLEFYKLDYNTGQGRGIKTVRDGFIENGYWRYYQTLYGIYDRLRARFPNVIFENCAGGGSRNDLGMMRQFSHTIGSDWQIAPRSFLVSNGMTMALPPEYVTGLLGAVSGYSTAEFDFQTRRLLFGDPTFAFMVPLGAQPNPLLIDRTKRWVGMYKSFVRPFIESSRIYHHTPEMTGLDPHGWGVLELASEDHTRAICGVFKLSATKQPEYGLRLRGLDRSRRYRVTFDNSGETSTVDGFTLMEQGMVVRLEGALTSQLLILEAV